MMTIHEKILNVQCRLMQTSITKTGKNKYLHYNYHELEDILPPVVKECKQEGLMFYFDFVEDKGLLIIRDVETNEEVVSHVRLLDLKEMSCKLKEISIKNIKNDLVHADNGIMTSAKRYLLLNMFLICEDSVIDLFDDEIVEEDDIPEIVKEGTIILEQQGKPVNRKTLQEAIKLGDLDTETRAEFRAYLEKLPLVEA